jgi:hypothetical protein
MEKLSVKRFTKIIFITIGLILVIMFFIKKKSNHLGIDKDYYRSNDNREIKQNNKKITLSSRPSKNLLDQSQLCLGMALNLPSVDQFETWVKEQGSYNHGWHWDNYVIKTHSGEIRIFHVVKDQNKNGIEVLNLKDFREDSDGPTLISEKSFKDKFEMTNLLNKKLSFGTLLYKQVVDTFQFREFEIKRVTENGIINNLTIRNPQGILDCQFSTNNSSCKCR